MITGADWSTNPENKITLSQKLLSYVSLIVRERQFRIFWELFKPKNKENILDVGLRKDETLVDSNFFEKRYPFSDKLTAISIEDIRKQKRKYPKIKFMKVIANKKLPFRKNTFDLAVSWATLEHVGSTVKQRRFLKEIFRVGKKVFITTPNKYFFYDPHSGLFFVHWFPHKYFSKIAKLLGKNFWADIDNFNPLGVEEIKKILPYKKGVKIIKFKSIGLFPTHLMIVKL